MTTPVLVLLASDWASLETRSTRWREVLRVWARREDLTVDVIGFPSYRRQYLLRSEVVAPSDTWLAGVRALSAHLPIGPKSAVTDRLAWVRIARAIHRSTQPATDRRIVIAAHPLWVEVATRIPAARRGFDAFDDWRARNPSSPLAGRIAAGYRRLGAFDSITANSPDWASRLTEESGERVTSIGNGVDLTRFESAAHPIPGLPPGPFAVYLGTVEDRVDISYLAEIAATGRLPVVVAGAAAAPIADELRSAGAQWLGPLLPDAVPGLLANASVGLVPHRVNRFTQSMDPMKVLEYLAAGLPVVSTPVPLPEGTAEFVTVASDRVGFRNAALAAASGPRPPVPRQLLIERSWERVATRLLEAHAR